MTDVKTIISMLAVLLTFVAYVPYVRDTLQGKTTPHVYTWFIWGLVTAIAFGLQLEGGGRSRIMGNTGCCYSLLFGIFAGNAQWKEGYY